MTRARFPQLLAAVAVLAGPHGCERHWAAILLDERAGALTEIAFLEEAERETFFRRRLGVQPLVGDLAQPRQQGRDPGWRNDSERCALALSLVD